MSKAFEDMFHRLTDLHHECEKQVNCAECPFYRVCTVDCNMSFKLPVSAYPDRWTRGDRRLIARRLLHEEN